MSPRKRTRLPTIQPNDLEAGIERHNTDLGVSLDAVLVYCHSLDLPMFPFCLRAILPEVFLSRSQHREQASVLMCAASQPFVHVYSRGVQQSLRTQV